MDSLLDDSVFDVNASSSDFEPAPKTKAKAAPKENAKPKKAAAPKTAAKKATQTTLKPKPKPATRKRAKPESDDEGPGDSSLNDHSKDNSILSSTPPSAKRPKKAAAPKKSAGQPLADLLNESAFIDGSPKPKPKPKAKKSATERYERLDHVEQIIRRPDTYIGSAEMDTRHMWVYNTEKDTMEMRNVNYVPGLYKIFDEILVNAADHKQVDKNLDTIKVTLNKDTGEISVWNNGSGIPVEVHKKEQIYIPEMIFGHLLTSSNYDDDEEKVTGGRNGYGAKLCNIFSTKFTLETADSRNKKRYKQTWTDNMSKMGTAKIDDQKGDDFTKVTFIPDFKKFKMAGIDDDFEALVIRRVYDLAGTLKGVKVYLNNNRIKIKAFKEYMEMFTKAIKKERGEEADRDSSEIITDGDKNRWEIGFAVSDGSFQSVSFVNSIATTSGGTHVNYIADQICDYLLEEMKKKKNKGGAVLKPSQIRNHLFVFVNSQIVNPAFTSQTKEQLTTKISQFGSKFVVPAAFLKKVVDKTQVMENIKSFAMQKADQILKKSDGNRRSRMDNPKLTDANKAGTKDGWKCTLILTEGDSAKGLAMTGRSIVGPDLFGVFPLRGKLLNVRDASVDQVSKNAEIQNIKNILGLKHKQVYTDCKSLRYGHIMIMTDQDHDGSHIKGLLINFLQVQYPSLLKLPGFLIEFITPIYKVYKGDPKDPKKSKTFFTLPEYEAWKEQTEDHQTWEHKYYKGLGTSTDEDAERYFRDLDMHLKEFHSMQEQEPELLELVFSKKKADDRKEWLRQFRPGTFLDHSTRQITYANFVNKELILFSMADNLRSIPSVVDGLKPGQRKVLFTCLKSNIRKDLKLVELAGRVMGLTSYHHGDASLQQTIVGLAQTFVGSNNVNTLEPSGNFGSRLQGGSDSASARYIFTRLSPFARRVFHQADEPLLKHLIDDNTIIEPEVYVPVVPMVLINGADGIGTGWSSSIPNYNPVDIVENLKAMMKGEPPKPMTPWFRDFEGVIEQTAPDRFKCTGKIKQTGDNEVEITELPIRVWTQDYKDKLCEIIKAEKTPSWIKDYDDYNTKQKINFVVRLEDKHMKAALEEGLLEKFKLSKTIATSNLVAFDSQGRITKYANVEEILQEFFSVRVKFYERRKAHLLSELTMQLEKLTNQARFVQMIIDGKLVVAKKKKRDLVVELKEKGFKPFPKVKDATKDGELEPAMEDEEPEADKELSKASNGYDYLLGMAIWSLTRERVDRLLKQQGDKQAEIEELIKVSKFDLWNRDLDDFMDEWNTQLSEEVKRRKKVQGMKRRVSSKLRTQDNPRRRKGDDDEYAEFESKKAKKVKEAKKAEPKSILMSAFMQSTQPAPERKTNKKAAEKPATHGDDDDVDVWHEVAESANEQAMDASKSKTVPTKPPAQQTLSDDDDYEISKMAATAPSTTGTGRTGRAAARKPKNYVALSDSEDESDGDFDVSKMVKGIGEAGNTSRPLFSTSASLSRPGSSHGLAAAARKSFGRERATNLDDTDGADDTDYTRLAPSAPNTASKKTFGLGDEEDSMDIDDARPESSKAAASLTPAAGSKKRGRPAGASNKPKEAKPAAATAAKAKPASKPKAGAAAVESKPKQTTLSPAAKAYASKMAKAQKAQEKDLEDGGDSEMSDAARDSAEQIANEMLQDDDNDDDDEDDAPLVAASARPSRRAAAATKKAWVVESDSEGFGMEESTAEFDDDDDD